MVIWLPYGLTLSQGGDRTAKAAKPGAFEDKHISTKAWTKRINSVNLRDSHLEDFLDFLNPVRENGEETLPLTITVSQGH